MKQDSTLRNYFSHESPATLLLKSYMKIEGNFPQSSPDRWAHLNLNYNDSFLSATQLLLHFFKSLQILTSVQAGTKRDIFPYKDTNENISHMGGNILTITEAYHYFSKIL